MRYYKLIRGYGAEDYIEIDETELQKAQYCFLTKTDSVYSGGSVRGSEIHAIQPDYHRAMGWNRGYRLSADDYAQLRETGVDRSHMIFLAETKKVVHERLAEGKELTKIDLSTVLLDSQKPKMLP